MDRAGAYAARRLALALVDTGRFAWVQVCATYAIGHPNPLGSRAMAEEKVPGAMFASRAMVEELAQALLAPAAMLRDLELTRPIFSPVAAWGHFGRPDLDLPWERPIPEIAALTLPDRPGGSRRLWAAQ